MAGAGEQNHGRVVGKMSHRSAALLAWSVWALCLALAVFALGLDIYTPPTRHEPNFAVLAGIPLLVYPTIGALVVSHYPRNAVGWVLCGMGFIFEALAFSRAYVEYSLFAHPGSPIGEVIDEVATPYAVGPLVMLGTVLLVLLFPDGKPPHRAWWAIVWMAVGGAALVSLWWWTWPEGAIGKTVEELGQFGGVCLDLSFVGSMLSVLVRLQNAEEAERMQLKWFGYGAAVFLCAYLVMMGANEQTSEWLLFAVIVGGLSAIPVAVGIAILRYRLYDIDVVINRTLVYGTLTATLGLIYFGGVAVTQAIFRALTNQQEQPQLAIVVSTLVIAALFSPLRHRIQRFIDRRFYRRKYDAAKTLEAFSAKLRDETDLAALNDDLVVAVGETMQPAHVSLWLRPDWSAEDKVR